MQTVLPLPDCQLYFTLTNTATTSASFDNRQVGCTTWAVTYTQTGLTGLTLAFQHAPDSAGAPGAWATFGGLIVAGINPNNSLTQAYTVGLGYYPWLRMAVTASKGAGTIRGVFYGYKNQTMTAILVGGGGTTATYCDERAVINLPGAGTFEIVAAPAVGQQIRICHISMAMSVPSNTTLMYGTGANCAVGPGLVTGPYQNVTAMALDFGASPLLVQPASALCITQAAAAVTGGVVVYVVY